VKLSLVLFILRSRVAVVTERMRVRYVAVPGAVRTSALPRTATPLARSARRKRRAAERAGLSTVRPETFARFTTSAERGGDSILYQDGRQPAATRRLSK
jgi:hypothetical protein